MATWHAAPRETYLKRPWGSKTWGLYGGIYWDNGREKGNYYLGLKVTYCGHIADILG